MRDFTLNKRDLLKYSASGIMPSTFGLFSSDVVRATSANDSVSIGDRTDEYETLFELDTGRTAGTIASNNEGKIIYAANERLIALDSEDGNEIWNEKIQSVPDDPSFGDLSLNYTITTTDSLAVVYTNPDLISEIITAYDIKNGDKKWQITFDERLRDVATDGSNIYTVDDSNSVTAFDVTSGEKMWQDSGSIVKEWDRSSEIKVIEDGIIAYPHDNQTSEAKLYALDGDNGDVLWDKTFPTSARLRLRVNREASAVFAIPGELPSSENGSIALRRINTTNGEIEWKKSLDSPIENVSYGHFRTIGDTVLLMTEIENESKVKLIALDSNSSEQQWSKTVDDNRARLTATSDQVVVVSQNYNRDPVEALELLKINNGEAITTIGVPGRSGSGGGDPIIENEGMVYHVRDEKPGTRIWGVNINKEKLVDDIEVMGRLSADILQEYKSVDSEQEFTDGELLVPSKDENLKAIEPDGSVKWEHQTGGYVIGTARSADENTTVLSTEGGNVIGVDEESGEIDWSIDQSGVSNIGYGSESSRTVIDKGRAYVDTNVPRADQEGRVGAYDIVEGKQVWETSVPEVPVPPGVIPSDNYILVGMDGFELSLIAIDSNSGNQIWDVDLEQTVEEGVIGLFDSTNPIELLGQREDSVVFIQIDPDDQTITNTIEIGKFGPFIDEFTRFDNTLILAGNRDTDNKDVIIGLDIKTEQIKWEQAEKDVTRIEAISNGLVNGVLGYVTDFVELKIHLIDVESGDKVGSRAFESGGETSITVGEDYFYVQHGSTITRIPPDIGIEDDADRKNFDISTPLVASDIENSSFFLQQAFEKFEALEIKNNKSNKNSDVKLSNIKIKPNRINGSNDIYELSFEVSNLSEDGQPDKFSIEIPSGVEVDSVEITEAGEFNPDDPPAKSPIKFAVDPESGDPSEADFVVKLGLSPTT